MSEEKKKYSNDVVFPIGNTSIDGLVGRILTIVDASIQDKQQREAIKTIVRKSVWDWYFANRPSNDYSIEYFVQNGDKITAEGKKLHIGENNYNLNSPPIDRQ